MWLAVETKLGSVMWIEAARSYRTAGAERKVDGHTDWPACDAVPMHLVQIG